MENTKYCPVCNRIKPLYDFYKKYEVYESDCKSCSRARNGKPPIKFKRSASNIVVPKKAKTKEGKLLADWNGFNYDRQYSLQQGRCLICSNVSPRRMDVDHSHETGKIRGLLCRRCNLGLGFFKDSQELLHKAIGYLVQNA